MTLIKWKPRREMFNFYDDIGKMISQTFSYPSGIENEGQSFSPYMNINESDSEYTVSMDLPGVNKKDVAVSMSEGIVTVIGERKKCQQEKENSCIWKETYYGKFQRSFELSSTVQEDKIQACFKDGVLNLNMPKAEEVNPSVKKITVK